MMAVAEHSDEKLNYEMIDDINSLPARSWDDILAWTLLVEN